MNVRIEIAKLMLVLFSLGVVVAGDWAFFEVEENRYISSRALKWVPENDLEDAVVGFVENITIVSNEGNEYGGEYTGHQLVNEKDVMFYICRAYDDSSDDSRAYDDSRRAYDDSRAHWVLGTVRRPNEDCMVRLSSSLVSTIMNYEVLHNEKGAAHLKWQNIQFHDRQAIIPPNVVFVDPKHDYIIARYPTKKDDQGNGEESMGKSFWIFAMNRQIDSSWIEFGEVDYINLDGLGQVLVAMEPVLYEVDVYETGNKSDSHVMSSTVLNLGEITLRNTQQSATEVESKIPFRWLFKSNWSCNETTLHRINTTIFRHPFNISGMFRGNEETVIWDTQTDEIRRELFRVSSLLPAETGVNITLRVKLLEVEDTLLGQLSTPYDDSNTDPSLPRPISVVWRRTVLTDLETVYGSMFHLREHSTAITMNKSSTATPNPIVAFTTSTNSPPSTILPTPSTTPFANLTTTHSPTPSTTKAPTPSNPTQPTSAAPTSFHPHPISTLIPAPITSSPTLPTTINPISRPASTTTTQSPTTFYPSPNTTTATPTPSTTPPPPPPSTTTSKPSTTPHPTPYPTTISTTTTTTSPTPITTTTHSNAINFDLTLFFKLKMKIPVK